MADNLPTLTRLIDDKFMTTWFDIKTEAIDNVLNATVVWAILNNAGSLSPQVGGEFITETIRHGEQDAVDIAKGDLLPQGEPQLETMAIWDWKAIATHVQRDTFDDQKNAGPTKIKDYVGLRLEGALDGMEQKFEANIWSAFKSVETGRTFQGINDLIPPDANKTSGTYGRINRPSAYIADANGNTIPDPAGTNPWWGGIYRAGTLASIATDLLDDLKGLYNTIHGNQSPPNIILVTQAIFEIYEDFAQDKIQIIQDETAMLTNLGFEALRFKGKPLTWSKDQTVNEVVMLNTDFIRVKFDPMVWFDMTDFKPIPLQTTRIAHILSFLNMYTNQPRRNGRLTYS